MKKLMIFSIPFVFASFGYSAETSGFSRGDYLSETAFSMELGSLRQEQITQNKIDDAQSGRVFTDFNGKRVIVEEYVRVPAPNQLEGGILNRREDKIDRLDILLTFNRDLAPDERGVIDDVSWITTGQVPVYLTEYTATLSNGIDEFKILRTQGQLDSGGVNFFGQTSLLANGLEFERRVFDGFDSFNNPTYKDFHLNASGTLQWEALIPGSMIVGSRPAENGGVESYKDYANGHTISVERWQHNTHGSEGSRELRWTSSYWGGRSIDLYEPRYFGKLTYGDYSL